MFPVYNLNEIGTDILMMELMIKEGFIPFFLIIDLIILDAKFWSFILKELQSFQRQCVCMVRSAEGEGNYSVLFNQHLADKGTRFVVILFHVMVNAVSKLLCLLQIYIILQFRVLASGNANQHQLAILSVWKKGDN